MPDVTPSFPSAGAYPPGAPPYAGPVEPPKKGMHGCLKGCLITLGVMVVMCCVGAGLAWYFWPRIEAFLVERTADMVIVALSESANLTADETKEMHALKDVLVKAIREDKFNQAHGMKLQASFDRLNRGGGRSGQQLTHRDVMRLMDEIEAVCRDAGCDMSQVDKYRSMRSKEKDTGAPDPEAPPDDGSTEPSDEGDEVPPEDD